MMLYKQFKTQPVQAFYKLLIFAFLRIVMISLVFSTLYFLFAKVVIINSIGKSGLEQISEIIRVQQTNPSDFVTQSKKMQELFMKFPQIINLILVGLGLIILFITYILSITQKIFKDKITGVSSEIVRYIIPGKEIITILIYILLFFPLFVSVFSLAFLSIKANPIFSIISLFFLMMIVIRSLLFIPGIVIGEMSFSEALKYSFQTINAGRAFKITVFGFLIFVLLSLLINFLFYFPMLYVKFDKSELYYNFLVIFMQTGVISVGLASLFTKYGNFEEENL